MSATAYDPLKRIRRCAGLTWLFWLLAISLLAAQWHLHAFHLWGELFLCVAFVGAACGVGTFVFGFYRLVRGPRRRMSFQWGFLAIVPILLWGLFAVYMIDC